MSTETMIKCLDKLQNFTAPLPDSQVDSLPVDISLTSPKELHAHHVSFGVDFPDHWEYDYESISRKIVCPYKFHTSHPYKTNSEKIAKHAEAWIKDHDLKILSDGWIKATWHPWYGDMINVCWWRADSEETAFYFKLIWEGKTNEL